MKLTTKGYYALQAMADFVNNSKGNPIRLVDISKRQNLPLPYLERLFSHLRQGEIIKSIRGPGGGYMLNRPAKEITISQILNAVNEIMRYTGSIKEPVKTTGEHRLVQRFFKGLDSVVLKYLNKATLEDLANGTLKKGGK